MEIPSSERILKEIAAISQLIPGTAGRPDYAELLYEAADRLPSNCRIYWCYAWWFYISFGVNS